MATAWAGRSLASITKKDVIGLIDSARARGPAAANTCWKVVKAFMSWCVDARDLIPASPARGLKRPAKEIERDRVLNDDELRAVWQVANRVGGANGALAKLLILTGFRRSEISHLEWSEIAGDRIELSAARTKSGASHTVHLSPLALSVIAALPRKGKFVMNGQTRPMSATGHTKTALAVDLPHWTLHDLRRSFVSGCARIGIAPHIIERMVNHAQGGIASIYQRHTFEAEQRDGWNKWGDHIAELVGEPVALVA
jgi:integrase